jgi:hypothetical protein
MILKFMTFAAVSLLVTALIALGLIVSDRPKEFVQVDEAAGLNFESTLARGISTAPDQSGVTMGDGWNMPVR